MGEAAMRKESGPLGDPPVADYLRVLRAELARSIAPELSSERARGLLDMATTLLDYLVARETSSAPPEDPDAAELALRSAIVTHGAETAPDNAIALTQRAIAAQQSLLAALTTAEQRIGAGLAADGASDRAALAAQLGSYLSARCNGAVAVSAIGAPLGGYSKDVFIVELAGPARPADRIVIRRDTPRGPLEGSVADEGAVLRAMQAGGVPVAVPLWMETDPTILGGPFIVLAHVAGAPATDIRANRDAGLAADALRQFAAVLGRVHAVDPRAAGIGASEMQLPLARHVERLIDGFDAQWLRRRAAPMPVVAAALGWMRRLLPDYGDEAPVIVHGDASLRNLLFHDGRATALLDWETWHPGDPAEDLAYCRDEVAGVMDWEEFLAEYRAHGGRAVSAERIAYWSMWKYLRGTITSVCMMDGIAGDPPADLRTAFGAMFFTRHCVAEVAGRLGAFCAAGARGA